MTRNQACSLICFCLLVHALLTFMFAEQTANQRTEKLLSARENQLMNLSLESRPEVFLENLGKDLCKRLFSGPPKDGACAAFAYLQDLGIPASASEFLMFDADINLVYGPMAEKHIAQKCMRAFSMNWLHREIIASSSMKSLQDFLCHGVAMESLIGKQGRLLRLNSSPSRTWGIWQESPSGVGKNKNFALILFNSKHLLASAIPGWELNRQKLSKASFGIVIPGYPKRIRIPKGIVMDSGSIEKKKNS